MAIDWWEVSKTFAGPAATVIAAAVAVTVTYRFGKIQAGIAQSQARTAEAAKAIAQSQRDIAFDKLKHDLFDKRYEIYTTARALIEHVSGDKFDGVHDGRLREMRLKLDEAKFFFPPRETAVFTTIEKMTVDYLVGEVERNHAEDDQVERFKAADKMTDALKILVDLYARLPDLMKDELGFSQLTSE
ncbi:hypothetical protein ABID58_002965 [Bradyrhizobium sp. S3.2.6]|uniref:hypothetical protein n=2 Tax=unclassified Bradyrhizobium TaxID=2631580 RepID=UPI0033971392